MNLNPGDYVTLCCQLIYIYDQTWITPASESTCLEAELSAARVMELEVHIPEGGCRDLPTATSRQDVQPIDKRVVHVFFLIVALPDCGMFVFTTFTSSSDIHSHAQTRWR